MSAKKSKHLPSTKLSGNMGNVDLSGKVVCSLGMFVILGQIMCFLVSRNYHVSFEKVTYLLSSKVSVSIEDIGLKLLF